MKKLIFLLLILTSCSEDQEFIFERTYAEINSGNKNGGFHQLNATCNWATFDYTTYLVSPTYGQTVYDTLVWTNTPGWPFTKSYDVTFTVHNPGSYPYTLVVDGVSKGKVFPNQYKDYHLTMTCACIDCPGEVGRPFTWTVTNGIGVSRVSMRITGVNQFHAYLNKNWIVGFQ